MKFYYINNCGDEGFFKEENLIKAIYTAWNIEGNLYLVLDSKIKNMNILQDFKNQTKLIFAPLDGNELNSDLLKEYGYYMEDGEIEREIKEIKTGKVVKYDWSEVRQLI